MDGKPGRKMTVLNRKVAFEEKKNEPTIFDRYRKYILTARDGYVREWRMSEIEEIKAYVEKKTKTKFNLNVNCSYCIIDLINSFSRLDVSKNSIKKV